MMHTRHFGSLSLGIAFITVLAACGGSDGASASRPVDSGLSGNLPLRQLSASQIEQLSLAVEDYQAKQFASLLSDVELCRYWGFEASIDTPPENRTDAGLQQACSNAEALCLSEDPRPLPASMGTMTTVSLSACSVTVDQFERCVVDQTAEYVKVIPTVAECAAITTNYGLNITRPKSCSSFMLTCVGTGSVAS